MIIETVCSEEFRDKTIILKREFFKFWAGTNNRNSDYGELVIVSNVGKRRKLCVRNRYF
jgi:hypothetical protein